MRKLVRKVLDAIFTRFLRTLRPDLVALRSGQQDISSRLDAAVADLLERQGLAETHLTQKVLRLEGLSSERLDAAVAGLLERQGLAETHLTQQVLRLEGLSSERIDAAVADLLERQGLAETHLTQQVLRLEGLSSEQVSLITTMGTSLSEKLSAAGQIETAGLKEIMQQVESLDQALHARLDQVQALLGQQGAIFQQTIDEIRKVGELQQATQRTTNEKLQEPLEETRVGRNEFGGRLEQLLQQQIAAAKSEETSALYLQLETVREQGRLLARGQELLQRDVYVLRQQLDQSQVQFQLQTDHPIAFESPDHLKPWGTKNDNSRSDQFNQKLYQFMDYRRPLFVLDLGCAGGGFVKSLLEDGHVAVGLEGSDFSLRRWRAEWGNIPSHLKTCDITKPFLVTRKPDGVPVQFDVITAWELLEHLPDTDLDQFFRNVSVHLKPDGCFMGSISTIEDADPETGTAWHQTVQQREWWLERLHRAGFEEVVQQVIGKGDWLRGSGLAAMDWTEEQGFGFHFVVRKANAAADATTAANS